MGTVGLKLILGRYYCAQSLCTYNEDVVYKCIIILRDELRVHLYNIILAVGK